MNILISLLEKEMQLEKKSEKNMCLKIVHWCIDDTKLDT